MPLERKKTFSRLGEFTALPQTPIWWGGGWLPPSQGPHPSHPLGPRALALRASPVTRHRRLGPSSQHDGLDPPMAQATARVRTCGRSTRGTAWRTTTTVAARRDRLPPTSSTNSRRSPSSSSSSATPPTGLPPASQGRLNQ